MTTLKLITATALALCLSLGNLHASPDQERLQQKLDTSHEALNQLLRAPDKIIGLELIYADPSSAQPESNWGHALLRFVDDDEDWKNDILISIVALVHDDENKLFKGLVGSYKIFPELNNFFYFYQNYVVAKGRTLTRKVIQSTPEQRRNLINEIGNWQTDPDYFGSYTFLNNNCAGVLVDLLRKSGVPHFRENVTKPSAMQEWVDLAQLSTVPEVQIKNVNEVAIKVSRTLNINLKDVTNGLNWPQNSFERLQNKLTRDEFLLLENYLTYYLPQDVRDSISSHYRARINDIRQNKKFHQEILNNKKLPQKLYSTCEDSACARDYYEELTKLWSKKEIQSFFDYFRSTQVYRDRVLRQLRLSSNKNLNQKHIDFLESAQYRHHYYLLQEVKGVHHE